jgi:hypothetical protein
VDHRPRIDHDLAALHLDPGGPDVERHPGPNDRGTLHESPVGALDVRFRRDQSAFGAHPVARPGGRLDQWGRDGGARRVRPGELTLQP